MKILRKQNPAGEKMDDEQHRVLDDKVNIMVLNYPKAFKGIYRVKLTQYTFY